MEDLNMPKNRPTLTNTKLKSGLNYKNFHFNNVLKEVGCNTYLQFNSLKYLLKETDCKVEWEREWVRIPSIRMKKSNDDGMGEQQTDKIISLVHWWSE